MHRAVAKKTWTRVWRARRPKIAGIHEVSPKMICSIWRRGRKPAIWEMPHRGRGNVISSIVDFRHMKMASWLSKYDVWIIGSVESAYVLGTVKTPWERILVRDIGDVLDVVLCVLRVLNSIEVRHVARE